MPPKRTGQNKRRIDDSEKGQEIAKKTKTDDVFQLDAPGAISIDDILSGVVSEQNNCNEMPTKISQDSDQIQGEKTPLVVGEAAVPGVSPTSVPVVQTVDSNAGALENQARSDASLAAAQDSPNPRQGERDVPIAAGIGQVREAVDENVARVSEPVVAANPVDARQIHEVPEQLEELPVNEAPHVTPEAAPEEPAPEAEIVAPEGGGSFALYRARVSEP